MSEEADRSDQGTAGVFFDGLPAMAGIVTVVAQPFAQDSLRNVLELPHWVPVVIAVRVSGQVYERYHGPLITPLGACS